MHVNHIPTFVVVTFVFDDEIKSSDLVVRDKVIDRRHLSQSNSSSNAKFDICSITKYMDILAYSASFGIIYPVASEAKKQQLNQSSGN